MTSVNAAAPSQNVYASALVTGLPLSPASIMTLLRRRMQDMDGQVDSIMSEIDTNTARSESLQRRVEGLNIVRSAMANAQGDATAQVKLGDIVVTFEGQSMKANELLEQLDIRDLPVAGMDERPTLAELQAQLRLTNGVIASSAGQNPLPGVQSTPEYAALVEQRTELEAQIQNYGLVTAENRITGQSMDGFIENIKSQARQANSGNEVLMVRLQSVMQQRSQTVTMATQMMKSITDTEKSVAQNIGR